MDDLAMGRGEALELKVRDAMSVAKLLQFGGKTGDSWREGFDDAILRVLIGEKGRFYITKGPGKAMRKALATPNGAPTLPLRIILPELVLLCLIYC